MLSSILLSTNWYLKLSFRGYKYLLMLIVGMAIYNKKLITIYVHYHNEMHHDLIEKVEKRGRLSHWSDI